MTKLLSTAALIVLLAFVTVTGCSQKPSEVGVFLKTDQGWTKLRAYDFRFMEGYVGTQNLSPASFPFAKPKGTILINKVPLDPSALVWGRNAGPRHRGKNWWADLDDQPVTARFVEQAVYEVSTDGLQQEGVYALVVVGEMNYRAYFFRIKGTGTSGTTNRGEMVKVPEGVFMQGCNKAVDSGCSETAHEVNVPAFEIDKYEVTVEQYAKCVDAAACTWSTDTSQLCNQNKSKLTNSNVGHHPMNCISWHQASEYCVWAGKRLCSESEWEKASRGTDGRKYPWGNETATCKYAVMNVGGKGCGTDSTLAVGSKPAGASPYGALDMSGNVWEWVEDDFDSYETAPTDGRARVNDPRTPYRVIRGGGFDGPDASELRSTFRSRLVPADLVHHSLGVRCCSSM